MFGFRVVNNPYIVRRHILVLDVSANKRIIPLLRNGQTLERKSETMLEDLVCGIWLAFGVYVFWYVVKAEDFQPLTFENLALTWRLHKSQTECGSSCIHDLLVRNDEVVGFRCSCGYQFLQKRLITHRPLIATRAMHSNLDSIKNIGGVASNLGLTNTNLRRI